MSGLKWVTLSRVFAQALTWLNTFFVIRLISPADFGLAALASIFANFLSLLNELGFSVALIQRQTRDREILRNVFGALLLIGVTLTIALIAMAPLVGALVKEPRVVPLVRLVSLQFLAMSFSIIPQAMLSMDMRF
jgi:teichuronic acid exporter